MMGFSKRRCNIQCSQCCRNQVTSLNPTIGDPLHCQKIHIFFPGRSTTHYGWSWMNSNQQIRQRSAPNTGIDDAFVVLECLSPKSLEWSAPIWFAGLVLMKSFDCIERSPLFDTLLQQRVPRCWLRFVVETLLWTDWLSSRERKVHH